jgi:pantetheine-phosphate adenylyltransferase
MGKGKKAVYAGSFDPPTNGHIWMIEQGSKIFDKLVVSIGVNPGKKYTFSVEERLGMLRESLKDCKNVEFDNYSNQFLINYAKKIGAEFILRGTRNSDDDKYERSMNNINRKIDPSITTIILPAPAELSETSSSIVKGFVGPNGWEEIVCQYVPQPVFDKLKENYNRKQHQKNYY